MATTIKIILDDRRPKEDGTFPIVLRLTHERLTRYIQTGHSAKLEEWDQSGEKIETKRLPKKRVDTINGLLLRQKSAALDTINDLEKYNDLSGMDVSQVKDKILDITPKVTFRAFTEKIIEELKTANKFGNASCYTQAIDFMDRHCDNKDYTFDQINYQLIKHLEAQHLANKKSWNSLSFYLRTIRAVYNRAIKEGMAKRDNYPFLNYTIKETKTAKRAIPKNDIQKLAELQVVEGSNLWHAKNYFMFSFYNIGMNFIDIAFLKMKNIADNRINYVRAKTGKPYSIKISEPTQAILSYYTEGKKPTDFVFNIVKGKTLEEQLQSYKNLRRAYAKWLRTLAEKAKINPNLTAYVARHSWATIAKDLNVPVSVISEGLGHEDIKTTQIYLDSFDADVIDKANELIIGK
ncbi:MAG: site-specific integrase [Chitinophagaceae bacterium]|nr:site-specific integrase [Chitinophagaceae bacterium]HPI30886.1 site-specific integrase [Bacteroidales bacterium]